MRKIREVLRLYFAPALSIRAIARSLGGVAVDGARVPAQSQGGGARLAPT